MEFNVEKPVRVRFAPSPTGSLHLGGLRTALFNVLLARKYHGQAILRIEDTDQERTVAGAEEKLQQELEWVGLIFQESPWLGGKYAPYHQSERVALYQEYAQKLLDSDLAYRCFCTQQDLERMRAEQTARGQLPRYDGRCRRLKPEQVQAFIDQGHSYVVRQKIPFQQSVSFHDLIRGDIQFDSKMLDDQVLIKSDGFPTYHLAHVVDDHLMEITHVIRGEEWIPSTPKHILLFQAFGWTPPYYAHLPLILDTNRQKLSKRSGDTSAFVEEFRVMGILPEALINYLVLLGWHPQGEQEIFSYDELTELFDLDRVGKAGAVFDINKLLHLNGVYIRNLPEQKYLSMSQEALITSEFTPIGISEQKIQQMLLMVRDSVTRFSDLSELLTPYLHDTVSIDPDAVSNLTAPGTKELLSRIAEMISSSSDFNGVSFKDAVNTIGKELSRKGKDLWMPVRVALTGRNHGPELYRIAELLGKDTCVNRIRIAITKIMN